MSISIDIFFTNSEKSRSYFKKHLQINGFLFDYYQERSAASAVNCFILGNKKPALGGFGLEENNYFFRMNDFISDAVGIAAMPPASQSWLYKPR